MQGGERDQLVAVDDGAVAIHRQHAVPVAVERERGVKAAAGDPRHDTVEVRRTAAVVDVAPVRGIGQHLDLVAEPAHDLRRRAIGRAVGAIEQDPAPRQVEPDEPGVELAEVVLERTGSRRT